MLFLILWKQKDFLIIFCDIKENIEYLINRTNKEGHYIPTLYPVLCSMNSGQASSSRVCLDRATQDAATYKTARVNRAQAATYNQTLIKYKI